MLRKSSSIPLDNSPKTRLPYSGVSPRKSGQTMRMSRDTSRQFKSSVKKFVVKDSKVSKYFEATMERLSMVLRLYFSDDGIYQHWRSLSIGYFNSCLTALFTPKPAVCCRVSSAHLHCSDSQKSSREKQKNHLELFIDIALKCPSHMKGQGTGSCKNSTSKQRTLNSEFQRTPQHGSRMLITP